MAKKKIRRVFALVMSVLIVMSLSISVFAATLQPAVCGKAEHTHTFTCNNLVCGKEDGANELNCDQEHEHAEECYIAHSHIEACYGEELSCSITEHSHSEATCFNKWNGDGMSIDVTAGENGYTFRSAYLAAYEMSNHMVTNSGGAHNDIPQTLVMIDASKDYTWTPNGIYSFGASNYEVLYCCDAVTGYENGVYYKRMNLEDSVYYTDSDAAKIRAIVTNAYPFVSLEQMKANLALEGFVGAQDLTRAEVITAVQAAIWAYANTDIEEYVYVQTFDVPHNSQWGGVMHDYTNELRDEEGKVWWPEAKRKFAKDEAVEARINALIEHLKSYNEVYAQKNEIVISDLAVKEAIPVLEKEGTYNVALRVKLNNSGSSVSDNLKVSIYVDGVEAASTKVNYGTEEYDIVAEAKPGQTVKAVVSGTQVLPEGVYFYTPESREISQSLVGVAAGVTDVYADAQITLELAQTPATGTLQLQKVDEYGKALTGAEFSLYAVGETSKLLVGSYPVDENGYMSVSGLLPGSYELTESVVPEGYIDPESVLAFTVDEQGVLQGSGIVNGVMTVVNTLPKYTVTYLTDEGAVVQKTPGLVTGEAIPGCDPVPAYIAGEYTYYFVRWNKVEGIEGAGNTVANTDIVYQAVMNFTYSGPIPETPTIIEDKVPLAAVPSVFGEDHFAYIVGYPDGNVMPEGKITRAEVATIFFRLLSEEVRQMMWCEENDFSDVNKGSWYNNAISTMAAMGIVEGYPDGTFRPDEYITRAEFAAIAARFELEGNPEGNFFNDTEGHWAEELINIAANNGWVEGYPDGSFRPDNDITRAEAMTLVNRVLHRIPEDESDLLDGMVEWPDNMDVRMWYYLAVQEATNSHDYKRKENPIYETWVDLRENRDWTELEY